MINNLYYSFCTKTQYSFILNYSIVVGGWTGGGVEILSKWNYG